MVFFAGEYLTAAEANDFAIAAHQAQGIKTYNHRESDVNNLSSPEAIMDSQSFTAETNRRYKVTWEGVIRQTNNLSSSETWYLRVRYAAGSSVANTDTLVRSYFGETYTAAADYQPESITAILDLIPAGLTTVGVFFLRATGTPIYHSPASASNQRLMLIEDIGGI